VPARRDNLRSAAGDSAGIPSFVDALFGAHRRWVLEAECAKPEYAKRKFVIERTTGLENPATVVRLYEICQRCPVRRECMMDALTEDAFTVIGCWGGTMTSERLPAMRRIAEQLTEPDEMTFENSFGPPTSSVMNGSPMYRVDRANLAEEVADEFEETFEQRLEWWRAKAAEVNSARSEGVTAALSSSRSSDTLF
jgi:hypothetical protein